MFNLKVFLIGKHFSRTLKCILLCEHYRACWQKLCQNQIEILAYTYQGHYHKRNFCIVRNDKSNKVRNKIKCLLFYFLTG